MSRPASPYRFDVLTLFPEIFSGYLGQSLLNRAIQNQLVEVQLHNIRDWTQSKHQVVDDRPYGGGPGMILKVEPVVECVEAVQTGRRPPRRERPVSRIESDREPIDPDRVSRSTEPNESHASAAQIDPECRAESDAGPLEPGHLVMLTPQGRRLRQPLVEELATKPRLVLLCGRYEGFDDRVRQILCPDEISIGDFILGGGEVAAMVLIDAIVRLVPGVLGDEQSSRDDSFSGAERWLESAQYTRPREYRGLTVPEILLSGNHEQIARWRHAQSLQQTRQRRADLLAPSEPND
ncbi:MAG TPA: tRNA (guanosine(37)-N1)-methyltransferase TrmD [Pirellulales bacterium]|jgi:tRNA (guanine37-N1)-methyltransferase|nr:tRNA (guanosine(37)-N1)-methyltransferase TrmD [Pirellulales bacterium]